MIMRKFLNSFDLYQLEGRYPDVAHVRFNKRAVSQKLRKAEEHFRWLTAQLSE